MSEEENQFASGNSEPIAANEDNKYDPGGTEDWRDNSSEPTAEKKWKKEYLKEFWKDCLDE